MNNSANIAINMVQIQNNTNIINHIVDDPCRATNYNILNDNMRNRHNDSDVNGLASPSCDQNTVEGDWKGGDIWYRFQEPAGTQMANSVVPRNHCGTFASGWLNGTHPAVLEENVIRQVCFSYTSDCRESTDVEIRNCGLFFLYKLKATPGCEYKYCGQ